MNARVLDLSSEEICQETHLTRLIYTTLYRARLPLQSWLKNFRREIMRCRQNPRMISSESFGDCYIRYTRKVGLKCI